MKGVERRGRTSIILTSVMRIVLVRGRTRRGNVLREVKGGEEEAAAEEEEGCDGSVKNGRKGLKECYYTVSKKLFQPIHFFLYVKVCMCV